MEKFGMAVCRTEQVLRQFEILDLKLRLKKQ
jgi:hypothetical protein